ncbi:excinuclease ABC subunit UvrB [Candidatus Parcubacteria bacterium]|nr:excinuclease ABC subunit UvrB [Candidatus Parcubacteria bacterium]
MSQAFKLSSKFSPTGDQPQAIDALTRSIVAGVRDQTLVGVTGSGKTYTVANVIARVNKPALVIAPNKTLAAQLYQEFKEFFPENAVHYFVSYYDYYQPEAYIPQTDTYIQKDAKVNEEIDRLRHAATADVLSRRDVIVVASVSCIYGIGNPEEYEKISLPLSTDQPMKLRQVLKHLALLQYERNDLDPLPGQYRVAGDTLEIYPPQGGWFLKLEWFGDELETIRRFDAGIAKADAAGTKLNEIKIFPAKHFVTPQDKLTLAIANIREELRERLHALNASGKLLEAERLEQRTTYDLEMLEQTGYCSGVENYSRQLDFRSIGSPPSTLLDYFRAATKKSSIPSSRAPAGGVAISASSNDGFETNSSGFLVFIDESHLAIPQIRGMYHGDKSRKTVLVEHGFRLPSAVDNRPLMFDEFNAKIGQIVYVSATPAEYEVGKSVGHVAEQLVRPTGLLDPVVEVRPAKNQVADVIAEIKKRVAKKQRVLVTTLTKRLSEELSDYLAEQGIKAQYLHSDLHTLVRPEILRDLRLGEYDVLVGINLLREGLDLPEVSLVAILDADKEGFLRNTTTLIQTMGRAARPVEGTAILYADRITRSMKAAIEETKRRRAVQEAYNQKHGITPKSIEKEIRELIVQRKREEEKETAAERAIARAVGLIRSHPEHAKNRETALRQLKQALAEAIRHWRFEEAAKLRDAILDLEAAPIRTVRLRRR